MKTVRMEGSLVFRLRDRDMGLNFSNGSMDGMSDWLLVNPSIIRATAVEIKRKNRRGEALRQASKGTIRNGCGSIVPHQFERNDQTWKLF